MVRLLHGGLQFQAIHHLFPRLPRHNLRKAQPFVIKFCEEVGLSYSIYGFGEGNEIVISRLADIGKQCSIFLDATKHYEGIYIRQYPVFLTFMQIYMRV